MRSTQEGPPGSGKGVFGIVFFSEGGKLGKDPELDSPWGQPRSVGALNSVLCPLSEHVGKA